MKLDPELRKELEQELEFSLPDPRDQAYNELISYYENEDPEIAEKLAAAVIHDGDMEVEARKHLKRESQRRTLRRALFKRYDDMDEEWHNSKPKVLLWIAAGALSILAFAYFGLPFLSGNEETTAEEPPAETQAAAPPEPQQQATDPFTDVAEQLEQDNRVQDTFAGAQIPESQPSAQNQAANRAPETTDDEPAEANESDSNPFEEVSSESEDPLIPTTDEEVNTSLQVYAQPPAQQAQDVPLRVFQRGAGGAAEGAVTSASSDPFGSSSEGTNNAGGPVGLAVYRQATPQSEVNTNLMAYIQPDTDQTILKLYAQAPNQQARPAAPSPTSAPQPTSAQAVAQATQAPHPTPASSRSPFVSGDSLAARLQVGLVAMDNAALPVIARADNGTIWSGRAALSPTGRIDMTFDRVLSGNQSYPVSAIGQSEDGYLGLPAEVSETTPALASDLARGALRGVTNYVQALGEASDITLVEGNPVISRDAPPLEANIAGSVAQLFAPPEGNEQQALVRVARIPADTRVNVVVLPQESMPGLPGEAN